MNNISASSMPSASSLPTLKSSVLYCDSLRNFGFILSIVTTNAVMAFMALSMNFLMILTFVRTSSLRAFPSNVLVLGLAISDFLVGAVVQPLFCILIFAELKFDKSETISKTFHFMSYQLVSVSFLTLSAITADRFLAIHLHLRYQELVTTKKCGIVLVCIWIASSVVFVADILRMQTFLTLVAVSLLVVLITDLYMIFKISRAIHRHSVQIQAQHQSVQQSIDMPRYKKSVNTMYYVLGAFVLCFFPQIGTWIVEIVNHSKEVRLCRLSLYIYFFSPVSITLVLSNSLINPIIYCWRIQEIRKAVKTFIRGIWRQEEGQ